MENIDIKIFQTKLRELSASIISGRKDTAVEITESLLNDGAPPDLILEEGLLPGITEVGEKFKANEIFIPKVLVSARAMKAALSRIEHLLSASYTENRKTIIIGTVKGDIHDIGKNIVSMMLKSSGFNVIDLGINVTAGEFISAAEKENAQVIAMSALLTTTMTYMKEVIEKIKKENINIKTLVGGAPVSKKFADSIGADFFANNAYDAVMIMKNFSEASINKNH
jgi:5-methyltetrahydrofolate--homocysteine methyltransferase